MQFLKRYPSKFKTILLDDSPMLLALLVQHEENRTCI